MSSVQDRPAAGLAVVYLRFTAWVRGEDQPVWRRAVTMQAASLWIVLALGLALGLLTTRTPASVGADAPSEQFSAERAFRHVQVIANGAHPTGSAQAEAVRRYIFDRFTDLGLQALIRTAQASEVRRGDRSTAAVAALQNVIGVLPGTDPAAPAVLVMAHSDSVPNSPGAGDDGVGVAVLLETARSLAVQGPHHRSVIFLVTDGEEIGLLGAHAFFERDPLRGRVGAVINMDSRGDAGRTAMFQLGPRSGGLLSVYGHATATPYANSLTALLFRILPNDTDFTVALGRQLPGLNFAFIGDQLAYHTPLATPSHLRLTTVHSMGGQVLPTARALADAETLPEGKPPAAYTDLFGRSLIALPLWSLILLWLAAAGAAGFAAWRAWRTGLLGVAEALRGAGVASLCALGAGLTLSAAGAVLGSGFLRDYALVARYPWLLAGCALLTMAAGLAFVAASARGGWWRWIAAGAALIGLVTQVAGWNAIPLVLALVVVGLAWVTLRSRTGAWSLWVGVLALGVVLSLLLVLIAPGAAPLVLLPTLLGAVAAAGVFGADSREHSAKAALLAAGAAAVLTVGWLCGWASGLFVAAGAMLPAILSPFSLLFLLVAAPFARWWAGRASAPWTILGIGGCGIAILAFVGLAPPPVGRPTPTIAMAVVEQGRGPLIVAPAPFPDAWTRRVIPGARHAPLEPMFPRPVWSGPAPASAEARKPRVEVARNGDRLLLSIYADGSARRLTLWLRSDATLSDPRVNAHSLAWTLSPGRWSRLDLHAPPPEGFTLSLAAPAGAAADVVVGQLDDGWPTGSPTPPPVPPGLMAIGDSGSTLSIVRARLHTD